MSRARCIDERFLSCGASTLSPEQIVRGYVPEYSPHKARSLMSYSCLRFLDRIPAITEEFPVIVPRLHGECLRNDPVLNANHLIEVPDWVVDLDCSASCLMRFVLAPRVHRQMQSHWFSPVMD